MFIANNAPMLWWYAASKKGHHMLECPGKFLSEDASSLAADPAVGSRLEDSDADGKAELGLAKRRLVNTSRSAAATKKGSWAETRELGPWCDIVRLEPGRNPTTRHAEPAVSQAVEHQALAW